MSLGFCANTIAQDSATRVTQPKQPAKSNTIQRNTQRVTKKPLNQRNNAQNKPSTALSAPISPNQQATTSGSVFDIGIQTPQQPVVTQTPQISTQTQATVTNGTTQQVPQVTSSDNPFDIIHAPDVVLGNIKDTVISQPINGSTPAVAVQNTTNSISNSNGFLFWIFLIALTFMALVVANARNSIASAYAAVSSDSALRQIYKEPIGWGSTPYLSLYIIYWLSLAIFIYLLLGYYQVPLPDNRVSLFLLCVLGICSMYIAKHTVLYLFAQIFPVSKVIKTYNFIILTTGILVGLILMPLNIFIAYVPDSMQSILIYITLGFLGFAFLVRSLRGLMVAGPFVVSDKFHFLLYLCTVELAPLFIIIKLVLSKT